MIRKAVIHNMLFKNGDYVESKETWTKIGLKEKGKTYIIDNTDKNNGDKTEAKAKYLAYKYHLDGGIIPTGDHKGKKSDYIVEFETSSDSRIVYIIELKGDSINVACEQLRSTIELLFDAEYRKNCVSFKNACNEQEIKNLKGSMIRLKIISPNPGNSKGRQKQRDSKKSRTHQIKCKEERKLGKTCNTYKIAYDLKEIIRKSGTCEEVH